MPKTSSGKRKLPQASLKLAEEMILEYQRCLGRIRVSMAPVREQSHRTDVERILYARGQEELVTAEELYAAFSALEPEQVTALLEQIRSRRGTSCLLGSGRIFLREHLPGDIVDAYGELLCDFRTGGYRILGDLLLDVERKTAWKPAASSTGQGTRSRWRKCWKATRTRRPRSPTGRRRPGAAANIWSGTSSPSWRCSALRRWGKRGFLWDVLLDAVLATARKEERRD